MRKVICIILILLNSNISYGKISDQCSQSGNCSPLFGIISLIATMICFLYILYVLKVFDLKFLGPIINGVHPDLEYTYSRKGKIKTSKFKDGVVDRLAKKEGGVSSETEAIKLYGVGNYTLKRVRNSNIPDYIFFIPNESYLLKRKLFDHKNY